MNFIKSNNSWLGNRLANLREHELCSLFFEIADFHNTGVLIQNSQMRELARDFSSNVTHTNPSENMRLVEEAILYEMSRRYYNYFNKETH